MKLKSLTLVLTFSMTNLINAATTIATYDFTSPMNGTSKYLGITATIDDERSLNLKVQYFDHNSPIGSFPEGEEEKTIILSNSVFNIIDQRVNNFSRTKIQITKAEYICMMMPSPMMYRNTLSVNSIDYTTGGSLRMGMKKIMGPSGCWVRSLVAPASPKDLEKALALKDIIRLISINNLKEEL